MELKQRPKEEAEEARRHLGAMRMRHLFQKEIVSELGPWRQDGTKREGLVAGPRHTKPSLHFLKGMGKEGKKRRRSKASRKKPLVSAPQKRIYTMPYLIVRSDLADPGLDRLILAVPLSPTGRTRMVRASRQVIRAWSLGGPGGAWTAKEWPAWAAAAEQRAWTRRDLTDLQQ